MSGMSKDEGSSDSLPPPPHHRDESANTTPPRITGAAAPAFSSPGATSPQRRVQVHAFVNSQSGAFAKGERILNDLRALLAESLTPVPSSADLCTAAAGGSSSCGTTCSADEIELVDRTPDNSRREVETPPPVLDQEKGQSGITGKKAVVVPAVPAFLEQQARASGSSVSPDKACDSFATDQHQVPRDVETEQTGTTTPSPAKNIKKQSKRSERRARLRRESRSLLGSRVCDLSQEDAGEFIRAHVRAGDILLVCGGDGTQNWVASAMIALGDEAPKNVRLVPVPLGTGNDFSRSLGWGESTRSSDLQERVIAAQNSVQRNLDMWKVIIIPRSAEEVGAVAASARINHDGAAPGDLRATTCSEDLSSSADRTSKTSSLSCKMRAKAKGFFQNSLLSAGDNGTTVTSGSSSTSTSIGDEHQNGTTGDHSTSSTSLTPSPPWFEDESRLDALQRLSLGSRADRSNFARNSALKLLHQHGMLSDEELRFETGEFQHLEGERINAEDASTDMTGADSGKRNTSNYKGRPVFVGHWMNYVNFGCGARIVWSVGKLRDKQGGCGRRLYSRGFGHMVFMGVGAVELFTPPGEKFVDKNSKNKALKMQCCDLATGADGQFRQKVQPVGGGRDGERGGPRGRERSRTTVEMNEEEDRIKQENDPKTSTTNADGDDIRHSPAEEGQQQHSSFPTAEEIQVDQGVYSSSCSTADPSSSAVSSADDTSEIVVQQNHLVQSGTTAPEERTTRRTSTVTTASSKTGLFGVSAGELEKRLAASTTRPDQAVSSDPREHEQDHDRSGLQSEEKTSTSCSPMSKTSRTSTRQRGEVLDRSSNYKTTTCFPSSSSCFTGAQQAVSGVVKSSRSRSTKMRDSSSPFPSKMKLAQQGDEQHLASGDDQHEQLHDGNPTLCLLDALQRNSSRNLTLLNIRSIMGGRAKLRLRDQHSRRSPDDGRFEVLYMQHAAHIIAIGGGLTNWNVDNQGSACRLRFAGPEHLDLDGEGFAVNGPFDVLVVKADHSLTVGVNPEQKDPGAVDFWDLASDDQVEGQ